MTPSVALAASQDHTSRPTIGGHISIGALRCRLSPVTPNTNRPPSPVMIRCRFLPSVPQSLSFSPVYFSVLEDMPLDTSTLPSLHSSRCPRRSTASNT
ncbi:hypothetical protein [Xylella fastidiosa]|uniref:hypothetical protein n=1 Tax=Xylella fastidiosa TaxID=2371 RepID=UPI001E51D430|nr:hypothetical protein [Xylella fastidiosa]